MNTEKENKLRDIQSISYDKNIKEIVSTLDILVMMFEFDTDLDIVSACRAKMQEGIHLLKCLNYDKYELNIE